MSLHFTVDHRHTAFLDPFNHFTPKELTIEVRRDPLSGGVSRIVEFRARNLGPIDHTVFLERQPAEKCPFCPGNREQMVARFLPEEVPEGWLKRGEAFCFPNAFPYEAFNAVVILSHDHYLQPGQFTPEKIGDAFLLAREAFKRLAPDLNYASINWNYFMPAGAGIVHPHFQIAAGKKPTRYQATLRARARSFASRSESGDIAAEYLAHESQDGSRWLGRLGPAGWMVAFAPRAVYDVMGLVPGGKGLLDLSASQVRRLAEGVCRVLGFFQAEGVDAYNMVLHTGLQPGSDLPLMLRLVSRIDIPPFGVDEINYFEKLHDENLTFVAPEAAADRIRPHF